MNTNSAIFAAIVVILILLIYKQKIHKLKQYEKINFHDFKHSCKAGDLILYRYDFEKEREYLGLSRNIAETVLWDSKWNHVAIVVELEGNKYIYGMRPIPVHDYVTNRIKKGSQLSALSSVLQYTGDVVWLPRKNKAQYIEDDLKKLICRNKNKEWDLGKIELAYMVLISNHNPKDKFACTRLVAEVLNLMGHTDDIKAVNPSEWHIYQLLFHLRRSKKYHEPPKMINGTYQDIIDDTEYNVIECPNQT